MGARLFDRDTRRVVLTEAGLAFEVHAADILSRIDDAEAAISAFASEPNGLLRLALPNVFGQLQIAPLLPAFLARYPQLRLELGFSDGFVDLTFGRFDAAIRIGALETQGDLIVRKLATVRRVICASPSYLARRSAPIVPRDLERHRILHFASLLTGRNWRLRGPHGTVEVPIDPIMTADNIVALHHAALAGEGIAILGEFVAEDDLTAGRLVPVFEHYHADDSAAFIAYPNARHIPRKVRVLVDFLVHEFSQHAQREEPA